MRKFLLLLLVSIILCGHNLAYGQRGLDTLSEPTIHIKFGDPILFNPIEGAELYQFLFSLYGHVDTIQTSSPYVSASEYEGLQTFESYDVAIRYYENNVWQYSEESKRVMLVTDSGTDHLIHDLLKAGVIPISATRGTRELANPEDPECTETEEEWSEIEIPIVYHVIVPSWFEGEPTEYLSPAKINQSMNILNRVFAGETGDLGVDTRIRFKPAANAPVDFCGETYYGITYNTYNGENNKNLDPSVTYPGSIYFPSTNNSVINDYYDLFPWQQYINIWVFEEIVYNEMDEVFGITSSPCLSEVNIPMIGLIKDVVGENERLRSRQLGYCVAHEMGHYFGLLHAWIETVSVPHITGDDIEYVTSYVSDGIPDTPDAPGPVTGCDYSQLSRIPYDNIMSYTPDGCRYRFTKDQATHMRRSICETFGNYSDATNIATVMPQEDILDMRIISPVSTILCGNNYYDIKIMMSDISLFESFEIEGNDNQDPLTFYNLPEPIIGEDNTYAIHIQLDQNLPTGNYNFILHTDCASISKQYNVIACDNNVDMQNAQWYFDSYVTLDFRNGIADLGGYSAMNANSSESGICNEYGDILFYTDGDKIWNSNHEIINELNQSIEDIVYRGTIALKFDNNHYAVVTLCNNGHLYSRLLDGQGNIINTTGSEYSGIILFSGLTAIPCTTGGFWLVSVKETNMGFDIVSLKITLEGTSFSYELGDVIPTANVFDNNRRPVAIKASPEGKYIVCATDAGMKIYYFNATYGNFDNIGCDAGYGNKGASVAFSPSGRFMYMTFLESGVRIRQYDMESDFSCNCSGLSYKTVFRRPNEGEYANCTLYLQEGPDGRIYFSKDGDAFSLSRTIGVIMEPDNLASTYNGEQDCHIVESLIDYPIGSILQNRENLPNLIDAKNIDICAPGFSICSEDCSIETLTLHNFSLSPSITWTIYDLEGGYLTSSNEIQPDLSNLLAPYNNYFAFIIEQYTGPGCNKTMRDTISFNAQMHIDGENSICLDGRPYTYSVSLEPSSQIRETIWSLSEGFHGYIASPDGGNSDLMIEPVDPTQDLTQNFTITCNIPSRATQFGCPYTASLNVVANPDCSFVAEVIRFCDKGIIKLTNIIGANLSNYSASILINGESQPMYRNGNDNFTFKYKNIYCDIEGYHLLDQIHRQYLNATILVSNNTTDNVTEMEVLIPRTYTSFSIEGVVSPALCENDQCVLLATVGGGRLEDVSSCNIDIIPAGETSAGDSMYYLVVHGSNNSLFANIVDDEGNTCLHINKDTMPYELREPTFSVLHSDICHSGETGQIIIEMDLPMAQNNHIITATWEDDYEGQTDFVLSHGTIYTTILPNVSAGTYTPTVHYTSNCSITLDPIRINVISLDDPVPTISYPEISYVCNDESTTSLIVEIQNFTGIEDGFVPFAICNGRTYTFGTDTYTTTINDLRQGNYTATVYYTSTCSTDIIFAVEVIPTPTTIVSNTDICSEDETASITIEMELQYIENGFTPTATWNNGETTNFSLQEGMTYITTLNNAEAGLYTADVQYTSYCSMPLQDPISIAVSDIDVNYTYISENEVGILLNFDPSLSSYTISITENGITTETTTSQNPYYFVTNINNDIVITTSCGTIPLNFRVSDVSVDLKSIACLESDADISFEISGGTAPYTATFTCGDYTTTQIFNNSGPCVMHAEIIQGTANHLTIVSANGDTYNIDLGTINNISSIAELNTGNLGTTYIGGTYIVTSGLTFDHDVTFNGSTIYCTYEDNDDITSSQWTVNGGKTVTFENCTIKAACPDKMWQGIVVNGNEFVAQSATTHATIDIKQNTIIADAMIAVKSENGGIVKANNSKFINNRYDIHFGKYDYKHTKTVIRGNKFLTLDGGLNNPNYYPHAHIYMNQVDGISIRSNTFRNENMDADISKWGIGVESSLSGFTLSPRYLTITDPVPVEPRDTFDNLYYGVKASGKGTTAPSIKHNVFTGNFRGVYINGADGARVLFNNFTGIYDRIYPWQVIFTRAINRPIAIHYLDSYSEPYSIYLNNSHVAYCEENTITRCEIGAYISNSRSGSLTSRMYRNKFGRQPEAGRSIDMEGATMVLGINSSSNVSTQPGQTGLEVRCNEYTGTGSAIDVKGNMRQNQGSENKPAGNKFHSSFVNGMEFNAPNTRDNYTYYQTVNATNENFHTELERYFGTGIRYAGNYDEKNCKSNYGTTIIYDDHLERIDFQGKEIVRLKSTYDSIVDRGNTSYMLAQASSISLFNMVIPFVALCNDGYLSDTVFSTLLGNSNSPSAFTAAVLIANSPLPQSVRKMVDDSDLPSIYKSLVGYCQAGTNSRDRLQSSIDDGKQEIAVLESEMFHEAINNDTVTAVKDTVITYLRGKSDHTYNDAINEYKLLLSKKDYGAVRDALKGIYGMSSGMDFYLRDELTTFCSVNNIYVDYLTATSDAEAAKILDGNSAILLSAVNDSSPLYSGLAEILYEKYADGIFLEYTPLPEIAISNKSMIVSKEPDTTLFVPYVTIYPNPTDGMVFVEYNFEYSKENGIEFLLDVLGKSHVDNCNNGALNIYSSDSKILFTRQLFQSSGISVVDLSNYPTGTYIIEIHDCIGNATSVKIVRF